MARSTYSPRNLSHHIEKEKYQKEIILLDFHSTKQGLPLVDSWSRGLHLAMNPAWATLQHVIKAWWKVA